MNTGKTEKNNFLIQNDQIFTKGVENFRKNVRVDNKFILIMPTPLICQKIRRYIIRR